jgi:predicted outer membrane repeat protein
VVNNTAYAGGGVKLDSGSASINITDSVFNDNTATFWGGAIHAGSTSASNSVTIGATVFANNSSQNSYTNMLLTGSATTSNLGDNRLDSNTGATSFFTNGVNGDYVGTAPEYVVTSIADRIDNTDDAYAFSLREAVITSNITANDDDIWLPHWIYLLTLDGTGGAESGDLDTTDTVTISGIDDGTFESTVDSTLITDAAFEQISGTLTLTDVDDI